MFTFLKKISSLMKEMLYNNCTYLLLVLLTASISLSNIDAKYVEGHLVTEEDWHFITRFCFLSTRGWFRFHFEYPAEFQGQKVVLYYDEPHQWATVYGTETNCRDKLGVINPNNNQIITLWPHDANAGCNRTILQDGGSGSVYACDNQRFFESHRERWWYFVISNCGSPRGLNLKYQLWMYNGDDLLHKEFSADEFYILPIDIAYLLAFFILFILGIVIAVKLFYRQLFHTTYKMFIISLGLDTAALFLLCIGYGDYAETGIEDLTSKVAGRLFSAAAQLIFLLMLILLAKGYTITRGRLTRSSLTKLSVFMTIYTTVYVILFVWEAKLFDPGLVLYVYESPPGFGLIALRLIGWLWFCYAVFFSMKNYTQKRAFYFPFVMFYTLWFWAGPVVVFIAMTAIPEYMREKIVIAVENTVTFFGYLFFMMLTRPGAANKNFPFHVKTTQVDIAPNELHPSASATSTIDTPRTHSAFNSLFPWASSCSTNISRKRQAPPEIETQMEGYQPHVYAPAVQYNAAGPNLTQLFLVSPRINTGYVRTVDLELGVHGCSNNNNNNNVATLQHGRLPPLSHTPHVPTSISERARDFDTLERHLPVQPSAPPPCDKLFVASQYKES